LPSAQTVIAQDMKHPSCRCGRQWRIQLEPVIEQVITTPLVALVNQRLEVLDNVSIGQGKGTRMAGNRSRRRMGYTWRSTDRAAWFGSIRFHRGNRS
jgi:hypothetical protein